MTVVFQRQIEVNGRASVSTPFTSIGSFTNNRFSQLGAEDVCPLVGYKFLVHYEASLLLGCSQLCRPNSLQ